METASDLEEKMAETEQKNWLKQFNKYWLQSRMLDTDGLALELKNRVAMFMKNKNCLR